MKTEKGTHRSLGKKGGAEAGLESGVSEVQKVGKTECETVKDTARQKPKKHGSIATK